MNLLLNGEPLRPPLTGIGNYTLHLLQQFSKSTLVDQVHCFDGSKWIEAQEQLAVTLSPLTDSVHEAETFKASAIRHIRDAVGRVPGAHRVYSALVDSRFERASKIFPAAVYHETNYILRPFSGPCVATIHDLSHIHYPQFHPVERVERLQQLLPKTLDRADFIITDSNVVRGELIEHFNISEQRIRTVYLGVDEQYKPRTEEQTSSVLSEFGLQHQRYVLFVATLEPRKGIDVLLDAWCSLPESMRKEFPLVLTGSSGWCNSQLLNRIEKLVAQGSIRHLGYVPVSKLPVLFSGATVFTYPSLYEGFGLPVLDAMSSGVPAICRAGTSMAEFTQGSCVLCETNEADELAAKLKSLLESKVERELWSEKGLAQAEHYTWRRCAQETADIYRLVT